MRKSLIVPNVLFCLALIASQTAVAAPGPDINAQSFELAPAQADGLWARSALTQGSFDWSLRALTVLQTNSLVFSSVDNEQRVVQRVHASLWTTQLAAASGWGPWTFAMTVPVALRIASEGPNLLGFERPLAPLFGDVRVEARRHLWQKSTPDIGQLDLAAGVLWALPTGASGSWLSEGGARFDLMGIASWRRGAWSANGSLMFRLRPLTEARVELPPGAGQGDPSLAVALAVGSEWLMQFEAERRWLSDRLGAHLALQVRGSMSSEATSGQTLLEGMMYADWRMDRGAWKLWAGLGGGVTQAYGSAQVRGVGGVQFDPESVARDSDDDGFDDRDDKCPNAAEDADGFEDDDGCPEPDNDNDGVLDTVDRCPLQAEDRDGRQDDDGCPDLDDDGDGIVDAIDKCPTKPEDKDGFEDADGCPEKDNDGDGILDADDFCPNAPENFNNHQDQDGCPDRPLPGPSYSADRGSIIDTHKPISFEHNSLTLTPSGRRVVAEVGRFLDSRPEIVAVEVQGHTDSNGKRRALFKLSLARAKAVKAVLIGKCRLEAHQIRAVGKGSKAPIASNVTLDGRSKNRRIEIHVLAVQAKPKTSKPVVVPKSKGEKQSPVGPKPKAAGKAADTSATSAKSK